MSQIQHTQGQRRLVVAITGASGTAYGVSLLRQAVHIWDQIWLAVSSNAEQVAQYELGLAGLDPQEHLELGPHGGKVTLLGLRDLAAPPSSGSCVYDGMVVAPCSMGVVGRIASGVSDDIITRVADVCLKERRKLVLITRETPLSLIHLRNMTALAEAGATILPAAPGFYHRPHSVQEMVDFVVARALQALGVQQKLVEPWTPD